MFNCDWLPGEGFLKLWGALLRLYGHRILAGICICHLDLQFLANSSSTRPGWNDSGQDSKLNLLWPKRTVWDFALSRTHACPCLRDWMSKPKRFYFQVSRTLPKLLTLDLQPNTLSWGCFSIQAILKRYVFSTCSWGLLTLQFLFFTSGGYRKQKRPNPISGRGGTASKGDQTDFPP